MVQIGKLHWYGRPQSLDHENRGNKVHADGEGGCLNCSSGDSGDGL